MFYLQHQFALSHFCIVVLNVTNFITDTYFFQNKTSDNKYKRNTQGLKKHYLNMQKSNKNRLVSLDQNRHKNNS